MIKDIGDQPGTEDSLAELLNEGVTPSWTSRHAEMHSSPGSSRTCYGFRAPSGPYPMTMTITIEDDRLDAATAGAIEVTIQLSGSGERRWCFFMTPEALRACGNTLEAQPDVRVHIGVPHMIVVSRIDAEIIIEVLRDLEQRGELLRHTAPIDDQEESEQEQFLRAVQTLRESRMREPHLWQSDTIEDYLEAALAWAKDSDFGERQGVGTSAWAKVRAFLEAGQVYE